MMGNKINALKLVSFIFAFSLVIEGLQYFIPKKNPDILDLVSNALGILLGWESFHFLMEKELNMKSLNGAS